jgi:hypothetical protein
VLGETLGVRGRRGDVESRVAVHQPALVEQAISRRDQKPNLIPTTPVRISRDFDGVWIANGEVYESDRRQEHNYSEEARTW